MLHDDQFEPADALLDALIDHIESDDDHFLQGAWAVEALADGLGVDVILLEGEGNVERMEALGEALGSRLVVMQATGGVSASDLVTATITGLLRGLCDG